MSACAKAKAGRLMLTLALAASLLAPGCASSPQYENVPATVADLQEFPQSLDVLAELYGRPGQEAWAVGALRGADTVLRGHAEARRDMDYFRERFFQPWDETGVDRESVTFLLDELKRSPSERGAAENMHPWSDKAWQNMVDNADLPRLERVLLGGSPRAAITVRTTDLRSAPTVRPLFSDAHGAGQGWPFDLFQQSRLHVGSPLAVYHKTLDGAWLLVQTASAWGWVPAEDVAGAGRDFCKLWRKAQLCAFVREGVGLKFKSLGAGEGRASGTPAIRPGSFLATADIGTVLPSPRDGEVLLPLRGLDGSAYMATASFAQFGEHSREFKAGDQLHAPVVRMPLLLTPRHVAGIGNRMMGQPYGWGGLYGDRDCSATMQDLFAPFGIWLPRHSAAQAEEGRPFLLENVGDKAKEKALREQAQPFRTLIWLPGHIGLYVGQWEGQAAMFHNMWGVRNSLGNGREGRLVVGRAVVTSLRPGEERGDVEEGALLLHKVKAFTVLGSE